MRAKSNNEEDDMGVADDHFDQKSRKRMSTIKESEDLEEAGSIYSKGGRGSMD